MKLIELIFTNRPKGTEDLSLLFGKVTGDLYLLIDLHFSAGLYLGLLALQLSFAMDSTILLDSYIHC